MLYAQFSLNGFRYVLSTKDIIEILPYVKLTPIPHTENYIAGMFNYRGKATPVIDICSLMIKRPSAAFLSSRIIMVKVVGKNNTIRNIGLLFEKATEILKLDEDLFSDSGVENLEMPFLGPVITDADGVIISVKPQAIFSHCDENILFFDDK